MVWYFHQVRHTNQRCFSKASLLLVIKERESSENQLSQGQSTNRNKSMIRKLDHKSFSEEEQRTVELCGFDHLRYRIWEPDDAVVEAGVHLVFPVGNIVWVVEYGLDQLQGRAGQKHFQFSELKISAIITAF